MLQPNSLHCIDCIDGMLLLDDNSTNLIIADPPYNIGGSNSQQVVVPADEQRGSFSSIKEEWDTMDAKTFEEFNQKWLTQCYRILKPNGAILVWGTRHNIHLCGYIISKLGFQIKTDYIWYKTNAMANMTGRSPQESTEQCIWAVKGKGWTYNLDYAKLINFDKNIREVFFTTMTPPEEKKFGSHPSQKRQFGLTNHLVYLHSNLNDLIVVPFCGSGTECTAALQAGRNYIGFDIDPDYLKISEKRLKNADLKEGDVTEDGHVVYFVPQKSAENV